MGTESWIEIICNADLITKVPEIGETLKDMTVNTAMEDYEQGIKRGYFY
ncbi:hypothetical protein [Sporomusa sphaeroides]|uniref:Uncharacterized protein n=1 Tax=Sporomusa sphaeroides DSM 2875 TaxID=1337886 RepID=A0ABM9W5H3_9FIRM|nr:hypothetical protein [Sporomusa sphaeroides]OLS56167.1 hypothetical protein SPSPH_25560 [Sporomusa sphaeroides DSM 2875]CVK19191.1 hypothetical protein SSPH_01840 [Sporomusa sphaeroides DSM 2875]